MPGPRALWGCRVWACGGAYRVSTPDQPREPRLQVVPPQRDEPQGPLGLGAGHAGLAQEPQVVRAGRGRDAERGRELAAHARAVVGQQADDLQAHRIAERAHDRREIERLGGGVRDLARVAVRVAAPCGHDITSFESSMILEISKEHPIDSTSTTHPLRPRPPHPPAPHRVRARRRDHRPRPVRLGHAVAAVRHLPRALGLLARRPDARLRDLRVRRPRRP